MRNVFIKPPAEDEKTDRVLDRTPGVCVGLMYNNRIIEMQTGCEWCVSTGMCRHVHEAEYFCGLELLCTTRCPWPRCRLPIGGLQILPRDRCLVAARCPARA